MYCAVCRRCFAVHGVVNHSAQCIAPYKRSYATFARVFSRATRCVSSVRSFAGRTGLWMR
jgi:hypothetical protein